MATTARTSGETPEVANGAKAEALDVPITFDYAGVTYTVPPSDDWPIQVLEDFEDGKAVSVMRLLLGQEQWEAFKATGAKTKQFNEAMLAMSDAIGVAGN